MHYHQLEHGELSPEQREALCGAFVSLLAQRLRLRSPKQIAMILELPDIRDTVCGQELIAEGEVRRQQKMLRQFATQKFGRLPSKVATRIRKVTLAQGEELFRRLFDMKKISDLERWLSERLG